MNKKDLSNSNRYGLSRNIPEDVKLVVRQKSGFGCVICGIAITQYEHFAPEFKDAEAHNPEGITLLCAYCHDKKTRNFLSKKKVIEAVTNPKALQVGYTKGVLDIGPLGSKIIFAGTEFTNCSIPLEVDNAPIISIVPPDIPGSPYLLSAKFYSPSGRRAVEIINNELTMYTSNWDIKAEAGKIIILDAYRIPHLILSTNEDQQLVIEKIKSQIGNISIEGSQNTVAISEIKSGKLMHRITNSVIQNANVGIGIKTK
jgi:hypothetical protein